MTDWLVTVLMSIDVAQLWVGLVVAIAASRVEATVRAAKSNDQRLPSRAGWCAFWVLLSLSTMLSVAVDEAATRLSVETEKAGLEQTREVWSVISAAVEKVLP